MAVIGAGVEGIASAEYLVDQGAEVTVLDIKESESHRVKAAKLIEGLNYLADLDKYDVIVRSPGIKRDLPELITAEKKGIEITSQIKIFLKECPAAIIGVTGTKGKGTTSALIYEMLKEQGLDVLLGGNIGLPPITFLNKLKPSSWVVLELSSFQLEDLSFLPRMSFPRKRESDPRVKPEDDIKNKAMAGKPHIAVVLMIVPEHLGKDVMGTQNFHESMEDYVFAKRNILYWQTANDYAVINRDYLPSHESDVHTDGQIYLVSTEGDVKRGCFIYDDKVILRREIAQDQISNLKSQKLDEIVINIQEILLPGRHNLENVCAAVMAADLAGVAKKSITTVLKRFKGLEHRLELVREFRGVKYFDDSFSTTPETAIAAIEAFIAPEIIILGGSHKGSDFTELGRVISSKTNIKAIIGIGAEWREIKSKINPDSIGIKSQSRFNRDQKSKIVEGCRNMEEVVERAAGVAEAGDVVLLSPACASFDMFKNYKERGEQFRKEALKLR